MLKIQIVSSSILHDILTAQIGVHDSVERIALNFSHFSKVSLRLIHTALFLNLYLASRYVHRVGRTARMGHAGEAILFLLPSEMSYLSLLRKSGCRVLELNPDEATNDLPSLPLNPVSKPYIQTPLKEIAGNAT